MANNAMLIMASTMLMLQNSLKVLLNSFLLLLVFEQLRVAYKGIPKVANMAKYPTIELANAVTPKAAGFRTLVTYIIVKNENMYVIALIKKFTEILSMIECFILLIIGLSLL